MNLSVQSQPQGNLPKQEWVKPELTKISADSAEGGAGGSGDMAGKS